MLRAPASPRLRAVSATILLLVTLASSGASADVSKLGKAEYVKLAEELSHKVDLFRDVWQEDGNTQVFGGTVRDYLYWLKGHFKSAATPEQAQEIAAKLRARQTIQVREFVVGESDVDLIRSSRSSLDRDRYGVSKIDVVSPARFDSSTPEGRDEIDQGHIPVEKIRLGRQGLVKPGVFGNGVQEIYDGRPTYQPSSSERFEGTAFAKLKLNHPILLALRYVRTLSLNYFHTYGRGYPELGKLFHEIDPASHAKLEETIAATKASDLTANFKQDRFTLWANRTIQKSFRSHTNQTATYFLYKALGLSHFVARYSHKLDPINQFLFATPPLDDHSLRQNLASIGTTPEALFVRADQELPALELFHGTREEGAFRSILMEGVLPSESGTAGPGLYAVPRTNLNFATDWGGSLDRVVRFKVSTSARIVDATRGEGARIWARFNHDADLFAAATGADIIRYPYRSHAYVVKNSAVLESPRGFTRQVMSLGRAIEVAQEVRTAQDVISLVRSLQVNRFTSQESQEIFEALAFLREPEIEAWSRLLSAPELAGLSATARTSLLGAIFQLNELSLRAERDPGNSHSLNYLRQNSYESVKALVDSLAADENIPRASKQAALEKLAQAVIHSDRPRGNPAVISALSAVTRKSGLGLRQFAGIYFRDPYRKALTGLLVATTGFSYAAAASVNLPISPTVVAGAGAVGAVLVGGMIADTKNQYLALHGNDSNLASSAERAEARAAILALRKYSGELAKGKSTSLHYPGLVTKPLRFTARKLLSPVTCVASGLRKAWAYDEKVTIVGLMMTYAIGQTIYDEVTKPTPSPSPSPTKKKN